ncbi:MAG: DMT family transporter [Muribaculaceae bacterium]|nr:DMT family transporter [Muribaculaceae bacterium]MBQ7205780.1 DMT family transporter [Muribaculaceae bacterium]
MKYVGELISIGVAFSWTATALLSEFGSKRMGNLTLNLMRMLIALVFSGILFWVMGGTPLPAKASGEAYLWMLLSGLVGYVIGDFCLFQCYIIIGSKFGQLFMTLAPITAAIMAWFTLGQEIRPTAMLAMIVTLAGIAISVLGRGDHHKLSLKLPLAGVLFAIGAAVCQGVGLVLSKIGMNHYEASLTTDMQSWMLPFHANFFRCIAGTVGFALLMAFREGFKPFQRSLHDRKGMAAAVLTTIFGPFVGVGASLLAVQYTAAGIASTLMALTPIIIILPAWWLFKQPITAKSILGAVISVIGVSLFFLL